MYLNALNTYVRLKGNLKKPLQALKAEQWRAFRDLVRFAYERVPFYKDLYSQAGFSPDSLNDPSDLTAVPATRKEMFQQASLDHILAEEYHTDSLVRKRTSGSSGSPLDVYYTPEDRIYRTLLHLRIFFHNGMRFRDRMAHISDSRNVPDWRYGFQRLGFLPKEFVYAADPPHLQLEQLAAIQPAIIYSYASSMVLLSSELEKHGECSIRPKVIFTTGELLNRSDRELIERAFESPVRDIYGIVEMSDVAWECSAGEGYHLNIDSFLPEVLVDGRPAQPGESGCLVITNLHSRAMPFIRYEVGDLVTVPNEAICPCGCAFPRISIVQGRADDWLYRGDGTRVSPLIFVIASIKGVQQYRMIQKAYDHLIIEILPGPGYSETTLQDVRDHVLDVMGQNMRIDVDLVDSIPRQSGKMRRVISEIEQS